MVILTVVLWCLVIFHETKKGVVNNIPPIEEEKIEGSLFVARQSEQKNNTPEKDVGNILQSPWVVEVCSYLRYNEAQNLARSFKDQGFPAFVSRIDLKGQRWYRVRVGVYSTEEEAQKMKEKIAKEFGITDPWVHLLTEWTGPLWSSS